MKKNYNSITNKNINKCAFIRTLDKLIDALLKQQKLSYFCLHRII